jgi:hypothetical protein
MKTRSSFSFAIGSLRRATLGLILSGSLATPALGETVVDLVPQVLEYFDVGAYYQDVLITIRNIGNALRGRVLEMRRRPEAGATARVSPCPSRLEPM